MASNEVFACCSPKRLYKLISTLSNEQIEGVVEIGFRGLLHTPDVEINLLLVAWIGLNFDIEHRRLKIKHRYANFLVEDTFHLMGLSNSGDTINEDSLQYIKPNILASYDIVNGKIPLKFLEEKIKQSPIANELFKINFTLFVIGCLLAPDTSLAVSVGYLPCIQEVHLIAKKNWAKFTVDAVFKGIEKRKNVETKTYIGCVFFLQLGFYEHIGIEGQFGGNKLPLMAHWDQSRCDMRDEFHICYGYDNYEGLVIYEKLIPPKELVPLWKGPRVAQPESTEMKEMVFGDPNGGCEVNPNGIEVSCLAEVKDLLLKLCRKFDGYNANMRRFEFRLRKIEEGNLLTNKRIEELYENCFHSMRKGEYTEKPYEEEDSDDCNDCTQKTVDLRANTDLEMNDANTYQNYAQNVIASEEVLSVKVKCPSPLKAATSLGVGLDSHNTPSKLGTLSSDPLPTVELPPKRYNNLEESRPYAHGTTAGFVSNPLINGNKSAQLVLNRSLARTSQSSLQIYNKTKNVLCKNVGPPPGIVQTVNVNSIEKFIYKYTVLEDAATEFLMKYANSSTILFKAGDTTISGNYLGSLLCTKGIDAWLCDSIIDAYLSILNAGRLKSSEKGIMYGRGFQSGLFGFDLLRIGQPLICNSTLKNYCDWCMEAFQSRMVIMPISHTSHWFAVVMHVERRIFQILDSMPSRDRHFHALKDVKTAIQHRIEYCINASLYLVNLLSGINILDWPVFVVTGLGQQVGTVDCGLWTIKFIELWDGNKLSEDITNAYIQNFRRKLISILLMVDLNEQEFVKKEIQSLCTMIEARRETREVVAKEKEAQNLLEVANKSSRSKASSKNKQGKRPRNNNQAPWK